MSSVTVTTNVTLENGSLDVKDHGAPIGVPQETDATNLVWQLTGTAAQGSFNAMTATSPGFSWIDQPPSGIFGTPTLGASSNQITMTDNNGSNSSIVALQAVRDDQRHTVLHDIVGIDTRNHQRSHDQERVKVNDRR